MNHPHNIVPKARIGGLDGVVSLAREKSSAGAVNAFSVSTRSRVSPMETSVQFHFVDANKKVASLLTL